MSTRKLEGLKRLAEIRAYYQKNPVKFIEDIIGAELLDTQAYTIMRTWNTPYSLWVCSRGARQVNYYRPYADGKRHVV